MEKQFTIFNGQKLPITVVDAMRGGELPPIRQWQDKPGFVSRFLSLIQVASVKDNFVKGVDLSFWNNLSVQEAIDLGFRFGILKATQNDYIVDSKFDERVNDAAKLDWPIMAYHFSDPAGASAVKQAKHFMNVADGVAALGYWDDAEWTGGLGNLSLSYWHRDFLGEVSVQQPSRKKGVYTRAEWWNTNVAPSTWAKQYDLWIARWAEWLEGPWSDGKFVPRDWSDWVVWQYKSTDLDYNYFNGDWEAFQTYYDVADNGNDEELEARVLELEGEMEAVKQSVEALSIRVVANENSIYDLQTRVSALEGGGESTSTLRVKVKQDPVEKNKAVVFKLIDFDEACEEYAKEHPDYDGPTGKPIASPPNTGRVVYDENQEFEIMAKAWASCKDNPHDHVVHGSGFLFGVVAPGWPGEGSFVRLDKIDIV